MKFAFVSCQSWHAGFYTAYKHLADEDVDVVLHLGRLHLRVRDRPGRRPAQHADPGLGAGAERVASTSTGSATRSTRPTRTCRPRTPPAPFVVTWDDHEVVNNYADAHHAGGDRRPTFLVRRANAYRAYWEHMPLRPLQQPKGPDMQLYRRFRYGDLVEFNVLDTRQYRERAGPTGNDRFDPAPHDPRAPSRSSGCSTASALAGALERARPAGADGPARLRPGCRRPRSPTDAWDGYAANRIRVVERDRPSARSPTPSCCAATCIATRPRTSRATTAIANAPIVAPEFTCTSISSAGDGSVETPNANALYAANPHLRMTTSQRGYAVATVTRDEWRTDFRAVPYITRAGRAGHHPRQLRRRKRQPGDGDGMKRASSASRRSRSPSPPSAAPPSACPAARTTASSSRTSVDQMEILRCIGYAQTALRRCTTPPPTISTETSSSSPTGPVAASPARSGRPTRRPAWTRPSPCGSGWSRTRPSATTSSATSSADRVLASTPVKVVSDPASQCVPAGRMTATATSSQGTDDASTAVDGDPATLWRSAVGQRCRSRSRSTSAASTTSASCATSRASTVS